MRFVLAPIAKLSKRARCSIAALRSLRIRRLRTMHSSDLTAQQRKALKTMIKAELEARRSV